VDTTTWLIIPIALASAAGWPTFFFDHFRRRKKWSIPAALSLSVVLGYFAICLLALPGLLARPVHRDFGIAGIVLLGLVWLVMTYFPHAFLITQAIRASRQEGVAAVATASEPSDGAESR
jgi:hypothetical protein